MSIAFSDDIGTFFRSNILFILGSLQTFSYTQLSHGLAFSHASSYAIVIKRAMSYCPRLTLACGTGIRHVLGIQDTHFRRMGIDISIGSGEQPLAWNLLVLVASFSLKHECIGTPLSMIIRN